MRKFGILVGLGLTLVGCNKYSSPTNTAVAPPPPTASVPAPTIPRSVAENALMGAGYQNPALTPSQKYPGGWMGTATKNGQSMPVTVDGAGKIVP